MYKALGRLDRQRRERPLVGDLENVAAGLADQRGRLGEVARRIGHADLDPDHALGVHQPAQDDHREQAQIDVAAAQNQADLPADEALAIRHHRGEPGGAGAPGRPARLRYIEGHAVACTPTISTSGLSALAAIAMPAIRPPPPIGTTRTSRSGSSVSISRPTVPWPAMIWGSS